MLSVEKILNAEIPRPTFALSPGYNAPLPNGVTVTRPDTSPYTARTLDPVSGLYTAVPDDTQRIYGAGQGLLVEGGQRTNHWKLSSDISQWQSQGASVGASKASLIKGETAYAVSATSSGDAMAANTGIGPAHNGEAVAHCFIEKIDSDKVAIGVEDRGAFTNIALATYEFSTDTANASTGIEANARILTSNGPNGGKVVHLIVRYDESSASGNSIYGEFYPDRNGNGNSAIAHHFQREEEVNGAVPIVAGGSATTRNGDAYTISVGDWWNTNEVTIYAEIAPLYYYKSFGPDDILVKSNNMFAIGPGSSPPWEILTKDNSGTNIQVGSLSPYSVSKAALSATSSEMRLSVDGITRTADHDGSYLPKSDMLLAGSTPGVRVDALRIATRAATVSELNVLTS